MLTQELFDPRPGESLFQRIVQLITNGQETIVLIVVVIAAVMACGTPQSHAQRPLRSRILMRSDAEQIAFTTSYLDRGMSGADQEARGLTDLLFNRSALVLPLLEEKIEQVLKSPNPQECFTNKDVDPQKFVGMVMSAITYGEGEQALKETVKLLVLDERHFSGMAESILSHLASANPFVLAYKGTDMGNPALDKGMGRYADAMFRERAPDYPNSLERRWADVMVDRYGGVPIQSEWASDPIVSNMSPAIIESMRSDMFRFLQFAWEKHPRRLLAMSDAEQVALVKSRLDQGIADLSRQEVHEVERRDFLAALARVHSSLVLPIIEAKIEQVLVSRNQIECFTNKSVNPQMFLGLAVDMIAQTADVEALKQAGKLRKLGKKYGPGLVELTLQTAFTTQGKPFLLAYKGLELGDPDVDKEIMAWIEDKLAAPALNIPRDWRQWAEAMVDHYGTVPPSGQWTRDPIASRLKPAMSESLRGEVVRLATEAWESRIRK